MDSRLLSLTWCWVCQGKLGSIGTLREVTHSSLGPLVWQCLLDDLPLCSPCCYCYIDKPIELAPFQFDIPTLNDLSKATLVESNCKSTKYSTYVFLLFHM